MGRLNKKGIRTILQKVPGPDGTVVLHLACGHMVTRDYRPRDGQRKASCPTCKALPTKDGRQWRRQRVGAGLCWDCPALAEPGRTRCAKHAAACAAANTASKERRRARGWGG